MKRTERKGVSSSVMSSKGEDLTGRFRWNAEDEEDFNVIPASRTQEMHPALKVFVSAVSGFLFGIALEKGRVYEPHIIREQMLLTNFTMLKMFLSASATGMLGFSLLSMIPKTSRRMERAADEFVLSLKSKSMVGAGVGGLVLGCGMTLAGACPGMVLAQVGAAVPNAWLTLTGGFLGAFLYAMTHPFMLQIFRPTRYRSYTLDEYMDTPYFILSLPFAAMLGLMVVTIELIQPWTTEVELAGSGFMGSRAWPPFAAGILIGALQIPTVLSVQDTLGSSAAYMTVSSVLLIAKPLKTVFSHLRSFSRGMVFWWQVWYVGSAVLGSHFSAKLSLALGTVEGVAPLQSLGGGILMIYGSRLAGGCTSGHGLSGMGLLVLMSFVTVPAMFAGGIATAFFMKNCLEVDM